MSIVALFGFTLPVKALEIDLDVFHEVEYTNNTTRSDEDRIGEWINTPGIAVAANQSGAQLELDLAYELQRRIYQKDIFDDETVITGYTELLWRAIPRRLDFTLRNERVESTERAIDPLTQANRQTVSVTEAGPTLLFTPRSGDELQIAYRAMRVDADDTDTDSFRHISRISYVRGLSASRSLIFDVVNQQVDFDDGESPDLDAWSGLATLSQSADRLSYSIGAGYTNMGRSDGRDDVTGVVGEFDVRLQTATLLTVGLSGSHGIRDQSANLDPTSSGITGGITENTDTNEVFTETLAGIELSRPWGNNDISLRWDATWQDYEDVPRDNSRWLLTGQLSRNLTPRSTLIASVAGGRSQFDDEDDEFDEYRAGVRVDWQISRRFRLSYGAEYEERRADAVGSDYKEWSGWLRVTYGVLGAR